MGAVATRLSDVAIVTSDNPRNEDPRGIIEDILKGCERLPLVEIDRQAAIEKAVALATTEDCVIAGKGHANDQVFAHQTIDFDDRVHALEPAMRQKHA